MLTTMMKWASLLALAGAVFFWAPDSSYAVLLQFVICGSASLVAFQAARSGKYFWTIAFAGLALLFNPLVAVSLSQRVFPWVNVLCFAMFLASLWILKTAPRLSQASITYPGPRSRSL
jgi:hypothetical protein